MTDPTVQTFTVHGREREVTFYDDGTHEGECVVSFNDRTESWSVLCPCGHFHMEINEPTGLTGPDDWRGKIVRCSGTVRRQSET